ncbi:MAG: outer membrane protein transport protein [Desulfobacter sp.]|nr:MAG: outer membrane protein transport protein [Desulfobacter sp.]
MRTWFRHTLLVGLFLGLAAPAFAGGIDNKQNFSAAYAGSLSRNAATDGADVAAYNPAGMMLLENGFHVEVDLQPFAFDYDHTYGGSDHSADFKSVVPTAFGIYKKDRWAIWGAFTINGGGGEIEYSNGNIITQEIGALATSGILAGLFNPASPIYNSGTPNPGQILLPGGTMSNEYAYAESYDYTFTTGLAYKINSMFSVAAGLRYIITDKNVDIHGTYNSQLVIGAYEQEADGFGGIFGLNIHPNDKLNIGIRYETRVNLDWDTTVKDESRGTVGENILFINGRVHGQSSARDLPAVFAVGLEWKFMPKLTLKPSFTYFFEDDADWGTQNYAVDGDSYEIGLALQYDINDAWSVSTGYLYIDVDMKPENFGIIEKMSPALDCHAVSLGAKYKMSERLALTFGLAGYFYVDDTAPATYLPALVGGGERTPEVTYDKVFYQAGIGIQYRFF